MAKNKTQVTNDNAEEVNEQALSKEPVGFGADQALENAKGKFNAVLVIGVDGNNQLDVSTSHPQYAFMQYVLNRASFELLLHEKNVMTQTNETKGE